MDSTVHAVASDTQKKRQKIKVKSTIFSMKTFAINKESFIHKTSKDFDDLERIIISNGGTVIDSLEGTAFVIQEDGYDQDIWDKLDESNTSFVHFRFI